MEASKKSQIIAIAADVFKQKGYMAASMQDIAEACGIAKGSLYKVFASKEELFTSVFEACHRTMFDQARELDREHSGLTPKERFCRKVAFMLQYMLENHFFTSEFKELPIKDNEAFIAAWKKKRSNLLTLQRDCIYEAYGESIKENIWDAVVIFRGMMKEYLSYAVQRIVALPMAELALFLVERLDAVASDMVRNRVKPVLSADSAYFNQLNPPDPAARLETAKRLLQSLEAQAAAHPGPEPVRQELLEVVGMLRRETEAEPPNRTLLRVLTAFVENDAELRPYARQFRLIMLQ
ncbi:TetR/AcrR family transcriptional regulator [Paenibacillus humicola]|uniref:TetR/AcrR family transcriptional regulator n=1 Tax=Paenibacillus humicola TaxID=3110540 RepID=UPI00237AD90D|nr:TetR/AcrR family transcriptional regulator [Paenibacillus humicola]